MFRSSRWHPSRLVKASIALGLAIIGALLVWVAVATPSTPDSAVDNAPRWAQRAVDVSQRAQAHVPNDLQRERTRATFGTRSRGWFCRSLTQWPCPYRGLVSDRRWSTLGSTTMERWRYQTLPWLAGSLGGPHQVHSGRPSSPGTSLGTALLAVFHRLGTMRRGDQVTVTRKDGKTAVFTVSRVARFSKSRFPSRAVYGAIDHAGLRLITCGGTYDAARHRYLDNVVVFARLETVRGPGG